MDRQKDGQNWLYKQSQTYRWTHKQMSQNDTGVHSHLFQVALSALHLLALPLGLVGQWGPAKIVEV